MDTTKKEGKAPVYSNSLKVAIAREYLTGKLGYGKLGQKHGLPTRSIVYFVQWYRKRYPVGTEAGPPAAATVAQHSTGKELDGANLKVLALEMLIENASKELGVDIVKKFGARQPSK